MARQVERKRIRLHEYGAEVELPATELDVRAVSHANKRWSRALGLRRDPLRITLRENGMVALRAEDVVGVVVIGDIDVEIVPKFLSSNNNDWQTVLWKILTVVDGGHIDVGLSTAAEVNSFSVPDLLSEVFLASFTRGAARGLPRNYVTMRAAGIELRGALDTSRIDRWMSRPWEVPYVTDVLTDDTPLARLLRWTAHSLSSVVRSPGRARALREIAGSLAHVGPRPPHLIDARRSLLGAQHLALEGARTIGILLLEGSGIRHEEGPHFVSGFLWNSDVVYENFVYWLCRHAASRKGWTVTKTPVRFGELIHGDGESFETTPDVVFQDEHGVPVAIMDAKYKRLGSKPNAADVYQIMTAGNVIGCTRVSLIYPVEGAKEPTAWEVATKLGGQSLQLTALPLDLMALKRAKGQFELTGVISMWLDENLVPTQPS